MANNPGLDSDAIAAHHPLGLQGLEGHDVAKVDLSGTGISRLGRITTDIDVNDTTVKRGTSMFAGLMVFDLTLNNLTLTGGVTSYAFDGLTVFNDLSLMNVTFGASIQSHAFAGLTIGRDMRLDNATFTGPPGNPATIQKRAFRTLLVERHFYMEGIVMPAGVLPYAFDGLVVFRTFNLAKARLGLVNKFAFYFLSAGTFDMSGSRIATRQIAVKAFSGMILTYAPNAAVNMTFGTGLNLHDCGLTSLETNSTHTSSIEELAGTGGASPFSGIIMEINNMRNRLGSEAIADSVLNLSANHLTEISFETLDAPFKITDLSSNNISRYEAGWASVILNNEAAVFTSGNPSLCNVSGMSSLGDFGHGRAATSGGGALARNMTLSQLNQGYERVDSWIQCTCAHGYARQRRHFIVLLFWTVSRAFQALLRLLRAVSHTLCSN